MAQYSKVLFVNEIQAVYNDSRCIEQIKIKH